MVRFTAAILSFVIGVSSVSAFVPCSTGNPTGSSLHMAKTAEKEIGVLAPMGYFDPLGLLKAGPYGSTEDNFRRYREVEIKHGRVAMLATVGMLVQQNYSFEGYISPSQGLKFEDIPNGLAALDVTPIEGLVQMAALIGVHEILVKQRVGKKPGDFGTGYFGVALDEESSYQLRTLNVEIQNGRLAMLGILGMFASEIVHNGVVLSETKIFS